MKAFQEEPTNEEIDAVIKYFKDPLEQRGYDKYLAPLIEKHGNVWVQILVERTLMELVKVQQLTHQERSIRKKKK